MAELISVIVTTYEREDALDAVLRSLSRQTDRAFEVLVADDGSGPGTAYLVEQWRSRLGVPLSHVWHPHEGFRAGEIRNRAVLESQGRYCVFLDGDCLARPGFIAAHRRLAEPGWFVAGNRALLSRELTEAVLRSRLEAEAWGLRSWLIQRMAGNINRIAPVLHLPLGLLRKFRHNLWRSAKSCNLGIWRTDLDRVEGFDATFVGWGREDSDLLLRLVRSGVRRKDGEFASGVLHLWHGKAPRTQLAENDRMLTQTLASDRVHAVSGINLRAATSAGPDA